MKKKILVGSLPRCGTNYFVRSLIRSVQPKLVPDHPPREILPGQWMPNGYMGPVIATHGPAPIGQFFGYDRALFLFGGIAECVVSNKVRFRNSFLHCRHCGTLFAKQDLYQEDALGLERTFDSWTGGNVYRVLCVKYEGLQNPESHRVISEFIETEFRPLPWVPRKTNLDRVSEEHLAQIRETYASLIEKIGRMPDTLYVPPLEP